MKIKKKLYELLKNIMKMMIYKKLIHDSKILYTVLNNIAYELKDLNLILQLHAYLIRFC